MESILHYKNRLYSESLAVATTRGLASSLSRGTRPYSAYAPYGFDRLYLTADGKPTVILREIEHGRRQLLDPITGEVRQTLELDEDGYQTVFSKQSGDQSRFTLGAPDRVATIRWIFRTHYVDGWGRQAIADDLNRRGVCPPGRRSRRGKVRPSDGRWCSGTVHNILTRPLYIGYEIGRRSYRGKFYRLGHDRPEVVEVNEAELERLGRKSIPAIRRPKEEWEIRYHPELAEILEPDVRALVEARLKPLIETGTLPTPGTHKCFPKGDKHRESAFFLKHILRSREGGYKMVGRRGGPNEPRYYVITGRFENARLGSALRRYIPAEPVEQCVLRAFREVLADTSTVARLLQHHATEQLRANSNKHKRAEQLELEEARLQGRLEKIYETADEFTRDRLKALVAKISQRLKEIEVEVNALGKEERNTTDPNEVAEAVAAQLETISAATARMPLGLLHDVMSVFCEAIVDTETRDLEFVFSVPDWAISRDAKIIEQAGLISRTSGCTRVETPAAAPLEIAKFHCKYQRSDQCYTCRRFRKAA